MLRPHKFTLSFTLRWMLRFVMHDEIILQLFCPQPKSFLKACNHRAHEHLIRVVPKKLFELRDIDVAGDSKQIRMFLNGIISHNIIELGLWWTRKGCGSK